MYANNLHKACFTSNFRIIIGPFFTNLEISNFLKLPVLIQRVKPLALFTYYFTSYKHPEVSSLKYSSQMRPLHYQRLISKQGNRRVG